MQIKNLIKKYGYTPNEGWVDLSKHPESEISIKAFLFIKEAQELLHEAKDDYKIAMQQFKKQGEIISQSNASRLLPQWWKLSTDYQSCLIRNNLL